MEKRELIKLVLIDLMGEMEASILSVKWKLRRLYVMHTINFGDY